VDAFFLVLLNSSMLSFIIPQNIKIFCTSDYIKLEGPNGIFIKKTGGLTFNLLSTIEGTRLFISGVSSSAESTALSLMYQHRLGLSQGYQERLRLVGIGFRATMRSANFITDKTSKDIHTENYRYKRIDTVIAATKDNKEQLLRLKIGYSHEVAYPTIISKTNQISVSRIDGRTKGIVISLNSNNLITLKQSAAEIRSFRRPDSYKGKGIYYNKEVVKLKKGKRQAS